MNGFTLLIGSAVIFLIAYVVYGSWLAKQWGIDPTRKTPAETQKDGIDYLPTKPAVLLGHHFSSIAGAGPIVGPITAAVFGWVPVTLWIIVGSVFFGGVHDYGSLVASLRHKGKSIGQIIEANIGEKAKILFAIFAWITLLVVIAAFANIVAATFVANPGAGTSSLLFILLAVAFGLLVYRTGMSLFLGTVLGLIGMAAAFYIGHIFPIVLSKDMWLLIMMGYIFVASIAPVWILLQPRDYLNSFLLYLMIIAAFLGICFYQPTMEISPFVGFDLGGGQWLFPVLFVTVACGAISGFHSLVSSGTSSKQLDNEKNAKLIGYGSMLIEGLLAICAIISVAYVAADKLPALLKAGGPVNAFSQGTATFMTALGLDFNLSLHLLRWTPQPASDDSSSKSWLHVLSKAAMAARNSLLLLSSATVTSQLRSRSLWPGTCLSVLTSRFGRFSVPPTRCLPLCLCSLSLLGSEKKTERHSWSRFRCTSCLPLLSALLVSSFMPTLARTG